MVSEQIELGLNTHNKANELGRFVSLHFTKRQLLAALYGKSSEHLVCP